MVRPNLLRRVFAKAFRGLAGGGERAGLKASGRKLRQCFVQRPQPGRFSGCVKHAGQDRGWLGPLFVFGTRVGVMAAMMAGVGIGAAEEKVGGAVKGKESEVAGAPAMREPKDVGLVLSGAKKVGGEAGAADLGVLGKVVNGAEDRGMTPDMKGRAQALAHYSAALQAEVAGDMAKAFEHYREVMRGDVEEADLVRRTIALAVRHGSEAEAEAMLVERVKAHPTRPGPVLRLVEFLDAYYSGAEVEKRANELMGEVVKRFGRDADVVSAAVLRHLVKGRRDQAVMVMNAAADGEGGDAKFWLVLAGVAQEVWPLGQTEVADEHRKQVNVFYERALAAAVKSKDRARELEVAQYYVLSNQLGEAKRICEVMAARDGDLAARKILYRLYEAEELKEKAFAVLEGIVRDDPKDVSQRRLLAEVLEKREQFPEAAKQLEEAIQVGSGTAADYEKLTNLWLGLQQPDKALTLVTRAIRLFPDTPGFQAQAGMAYAAKEDLPRAIEAFGEAERLGAAGGAMVFNHRFHFRFGVVLEQAERYEAAEAQLRKSIEMTPESEGAFRANTMNYLAYMWTERGERLDEAETMIRQAVQIEPDNAAFVDSLGWLLHKRGKQAEALVELKRAEGLLKVMEPGDAEILEHIAAVEEALGKKAEAVETLKRAAALQTPDEGVAKRILEGLRRLGGVR